MGETLYTDGSAIACRNCAAALAPGQKFCGACGQRTDIEPRLTMREISHDIVHAITHADHSIFALVRGVVVGPGQTANVDFALSAAAAALSEVVVTGYGTDNRRSVTSAIARVDSSAITNNPVAGVDAALQGKAAGLQVIQNSGNPGVGITVRVRGASSLSANNQPLYVIDGIPMLRETYSQLGVGGQDITAVTGISPDEIESIDILKDASSAAIYGSRGSNGVIQITTKRGKAGQRRFSFNIYSGRQEAERTMDMVDAREYVEFMNEARADAGLTPRYTPGTHDQINTNWQEEVLRPAPVHDAFLSMSGGSERLRYLIGGSYFKQEGVVLGSEYDRQTVRANVDFDATDRFTIKTSIGLSREVHDRIENDNTIEGVMANAIANAPIFPVRQPDGRFTHRNDRIAGQRLPYVNPVAVGELAAVESRSLRALGNIEGQLSFTDQLRLTARVGLDLLNLRDLEWGSPLIIGAYSAGAQGVAKIGNNTAHRYVLESFLGYNRAFTNTELAFTLGGSVEYNESELDFVRGEGFAFPQPQYVRNAGTITDYDGDKTGHNLVSAFTRASATFKDRYIVNASARIDGSSRFGVNTRYGVFPSVSFAWRLSDEPAFQGLASRADIKLRASYGETGNQDINDDFAPLERYTRANYADIPGIRPRNIANPDLKWETTREFDVGFDVGLLDSRLIIIGDYYVKKTDDLLVERPITRTSGFESFWDNVGNLENRGYELGITSVNWKAAEPDGFEWTTDFNISWNRNKITRLFRGEPFDDGFDGINRVEEGQPLGAFYTILFTGVDPLTGDARFFDKDGDGIEGDSDDRMIVGSPHPDYYGGFANTFTWRRFDLRGFFQFSQGFEVYNGIRAYADDGGVNADNKFQSVMRRWRNPGDITDVPRANADCESLACVVSTRFIEDGSYIRLGEVTLGYQIPARLARTTNLVDARIYVSGRNLKTWTDFTGFNPDANSSGSSANTSLGTEFYSYPLARTITIGVSGSF